MRMAQIISPKEEATLILKVIRLLKHNFLNFLIFASFSGHYVKISKKNILLYYFENLLNYLKMYIGFVAELKQ